jgi:hypothetical protein
MLFERNNVFLHKISKSQFAQRYTNVYTELSFLANASNGLVIKKKSFCEIVHWNGNSIMYPIKSLKNVIEVPRASYIPTWNSSDVLELMR